MTSQQRSAFMRFFLIQRIADLARFGETWRKNGGRLSRTPPQSSSQLGNLFDVAVGEALATMLGGIPVIKPTSTTLTPSVADCVEVGHVSIIGGVRPQNFDVGYRPDGARFAFDSKTLNDTDSLRKNWQNMINDLATEATTVHSRFPHAVVAFMVIIPTTAASKQTCLILRRLYDLISFLCLLELHTSIVTRVCRRTQ